MIFITQFILAFLFVLSLVMLIFFFNFGFCPEIGSLLSILACFQVLGGIFLVGLMFVLLADLMVVLFHLICLNDY